MIKRVFWIVLGLPNLCWAQPFDQEVHLPFLQQDVQVPGRIRQLSLEQVLASAEREIVILSRDGTFPHWKGILSIWSYSHSAKRVMLSSRFELPSETILYGFVQGESDSYLLLVLPNQVKLGRLIKSEWVFESSLQANIASASEISYGSMAAPIDPMIQLRPNEKLFWVPTVDGYQLFAVERARLVKKEKISLKPKSFYHASHDLLPFEFQYWFRNVFWFPKVEVGSLDGQTPVLLSPWMDELTIANPKTPDQQLTHHFSLLNESERDDGIHYIVNRPVDLNGDGRTDFLVNKFMGTGTAFRAQNYFYMTGPDGKIPTQKSPIKTDPKRASAALVKDLNGDQRQDLIVVSSAFTPWAMVRAIMKRQVLLEFDFYRFKQPEQPYQFSKADLHHEVLFDFHLGDLFIDGILPTLEGDFNGDGYPDVFYARNRQTLSFLIQSPKENQFFSNSPTATVAMQVPRKYRMGDITGDGKDDLVFFNTRENKNRWMTVMLNKGQW